MPETSNAQANEALANSPTPLDSQKWNWLESAASEASRVRNDEAHFDKFEKWLGLYYGQHYPESTPSYRPPVVVNELRTLILQEASDLSDTNFRVYVMSNPRSGGRDEAAERAFRAFWVRQHVDLKIVESVVWASIVGTGFLRVWWDPDAFYGMGDVVVEVVDPRLVLPDPDATDDQHMFYRLVESVLDLTEIQRLFPRRGYEVTPEERYSMKGAGNDVGIGTTHVSSSLQTGWPISGPLSAGDALLGRSYKGYKKARARVLDCIIDDPTIETVAIPLKGPLGETMKNESGEEIYESLRQMKYPGGRRIVGANGIILYDGPNTNPGGDKEIIRVTLEPTLGRFWGGQGFVQQTGELQLAADKLTSAVVENAIRLNNGIIVVKGNTGLEWESFASIPGQIVQLARDGEFTIVYPPPMPPDMIQAPWRLLDMQRRVLGFPDPRTGQSGAGNVSPELTEVEISQSQGTTRLRAKHLYHVVQRLAEMVFARMAANYTTERAIPAVEGEQFKPVVWKPIENPEHYAIYVDPASFQVMSRSLLRRTALLLYKMGAVDRTAVLEQLGWPHWEEVAGRMDQAEQMMAVAKMQAKKK